MKLDRNISPDGRGKYALVKMRKLEVFDPLNHELAQGALDTLERIGMLDFGDAKENDFFVLRLRDMGAAAALYAYAKFFENIDPEWAAECKALADKSYARFDRKMPD